MSPTHEANLIELTRCAVTFRKQCKCHPATASGPRIILASRSTILDSEFTFRATMVAFACDVCDTKWEQK